MTTNFSSDFISSRFPPSLGSSYMGFHDAPPTHQTGSRLRVFELISALKALPALDLVSAAMSSERPSVTTPHMKVHLHRPLPLTLLFFYIMLNTISQFILNVEFFINLFSASSSGMQASPRQLSSLSPRPHGHISNIQDSF